MNWTTLKRWAPLVMIILNSVGVAGVLLGFGEIILQFTALNLLINGILAAWLDWDYRSRVWVYAALGGWLVECFGVHTGWLFGAYHYGHGLGLQVAEVPLILGALWFVTLMGFGHWGGRWLLRFRLGTKAHKVGTAIVAATLMMGLDAFIEPVAIQSGWWEWAQGDVPWTNYASWWAIAFLFHLVPRQSTESKGTGILVLIFAAFFILLNVFPWTV